MMYAPTGGHAIPATNAIPVFDGMAAAKARQIMMMIAEMPDFHVDDCGYILALRQELTTIAGDERYARSARRYVST